MVGRTHLNMSGRYMTVFYFLENFFIRKELYPEIIGYGSTTKIKKNGGWFTESLFHAASRYTELLRVGHLFF